MSRRRNGTCCAICLSRARVVLFELSLFDEDHWEYIQFPCCGACRSSFREMLRGVTCHVA